MQKEFSIEYDEELNKFTCDINGVIRYSPFVRDLLDDVAKLYDYEPKIIYSESHFAKVLEDELNIAIDINIDY